MTTLTGPQYYPGASHSGASWYEDNWGGDPQDVNVLVVHTTEGTSLPTYADSSGRAGANAPNLTFMSDMVRRHLVGVQHYRIDISSRAMVNKLGGVATNTNNVTQLELVGTCDPKHRVSWNGLRAGVDYIYWPEAPEWALDDVAEYVAWLHEEHGVPLVAPAKWPAYPTSYANGGGQRMTAAQWNAFKGVCGHMHPPENVHGDPGNIAIVKILAKAKALLGLNLPPTVPTPIPFPPNPVPGKPSLPAPYPGRKYFRAGADNKYVTQLGRQLVKKGFGKHYTSGPGPKWGEADRLNVRDFQRSKAVLKGDADGYPGPLTWQLLFS